MTDSFESKNHPHPVSSIFQSRNKCEVLEKSIQVIAYNKDVDTLSLPLQNQLDTIIVGHSNRVGMDLIHQIRMWSTASLVEAICHAIF